MTKAFPIVMLLLLFNSAAYTLVIHIAPVIYYTEQKAGSINFQELLIRELETLFQWEKISFKALDDAIDAPKSFMDAMRICSEYKLDYLLYGYVEEKELSLYGELKLYDGQKQEVVQVFYAGDNKENALRLAADLAEKITDYFKTVIGITLSIDDELPTEGIISFVIGGGYWTPLTLEWSHYIQPLYAACFAVRFIPWKPAAGKGLRGLYFKTGLDCSFYHSINQPGYENSNLFTFTFGIPFALCLDIGIRHTIALSVEPQFAFDYLVKTILYDDTMKFPALFFSSVANLEYQFHFTKHFTMSIGNIVLIQFFNLTRLSYNPVLLLELSLNPLFPGEKNNEK